MQGHRPPQEEYGPLCERSYAHKSPTSTSYFGIGMDSALPMARSVNQIVSPTGSTPVGVLSPCLITVTLALSPLTVMTEILPEPFSATMSLPSATRIPSGPFIGWSIQISTGCPAFPAASTGMRYRLFENTLFTYSVPSTKVI